MDMSEISNQVAAAHVDVRDEVSSLTFLDSLDQP